MESRMLEHVVGNFFRNSEGEIVTGELIGKNPALVIAVGAFSQLSARSYMDSKWDVRSKGYKNADGYTLSEDVRVKNGYEAKFPFRVENEITFAVNFYKTEPYVSPERHLCKKGNP